MTKAESGSLGGRKHVKKGFSMLAPEQRKALAKAGAAARWGGKIKSK